MPFSLKLLEKLAQYALYHRCKRNLWTHFVGVPLIVFSVMVLLAKPGIWLGSFYFSALWLGIALSITYYLYLDLKVGTVMGVWFLLMGYVAEPIGFYHWSIWLSIGVGVFVFGWILQFIGHHYEGKKPAFVDDLIGLAIGPVFVLVELLFLLGVWKTLEAEINSRSGPMRA